MWRVFWDSKCTTCLPTWMWRLGSATLILGNLYLNVKVNMIQAEINNVRRAGSSRTKLCQIRVHAVALHVRGQWSIACFTRIIIKLNNPALSVHLPCLAALEPLFTVTVVQSLRQGGHHLQITIDRKQTRMWTISTIWLSWL
jgi:hypothetical protein